MSVFTKDYDYLLPDGLIARHPLPRREDSRMMVIHRDVERIEHRSFKDFPAFISAGDLVLLNDTRVIAARVFSDDRGVELLLLEELERNVWKCMVKPGRKMRVGATIHVEDVRGQVIEILRDGERLIRFAAPLDLERVGELPLPPYLNRAPEPADADRYQTVFAREAGAIAAPTAGLHFTAEMLANLPHAFVTLHVGAGTFRPVQSDLVTDHRMHAERFSISPAAADALNRARRIIAVGTTTARVLESSPRPIAAGAGETDIFIHPPYEFRHTDVLLTNFHLPKSTLLMLVSAFAGRELILSAYAEAVRERYRFYSYGDCMLII